MRLKKIVNKAMAQITLQQVKRIEHLLPLKKKRKYFNTACILHCHFCLFCFYFFLVLYNQFLLTQLN